MTNGINSIQQVLDEMKACSNSQDQSEAHIKADYLLTKLVELLASELNTYSTMNTVAEIMRFYEQIDKWYE